jgi:D-beta-D-heptose 7-phosphate kinase/D-beta-D-heptose 1-phosphate adenosyltransferase
MTSGDLLARFQGLKALVVGDLMLDEYIFGQATRISQEAPVMVIRQKSTRIVPGGAANVAANLTAFGATPTMVGVIGDDPYGEALARMIGQEGLVRDPGRPTTRKTRVLGNHSHQVVRIDHEDDHPVSEDIESAILEKALSRLPNSNVLLISDYQKGSVTATTVTRLIESAASLGVPVVANPKPRSLASYRGATLVSLNRFEAGDALKMGPLEDSEAHSAAARLREQAGVENLLVTLGGSGMVLATAQDVFQVPAVKVEVYDEAGAGDTVIATIALGVAAKSLSRELLLLATHTAAAVVLKVCVAVPTGEDLEAITRETAG